MYGESFGAAIVPISWGTNAAAEFGDHPQQLLNKQIVDQSDICLALFANRIGTPTSNAESGTAEEIERISSTGRYVAILRSRRPVDASQVDLEQAAKLGEYLTRIRTNALVLDYETDGELSERVDTILAAAVARDQGRADLQLQQEHKGPPARIAEVWPRVESAEVPTTIGSRRTWYLVLANTGDAPAGDVQVRLETYDDQAKPWRIYAGSSEGVPEIEVLAPHSEMKFQIVASLASAPQVRCIVSWSDERGRQDNTATLLLS
jgi:hypothetical protein